MNRQTIMRPNTLESVDCRLTREPLSTTDSKLKVVPFLTESDFELSSGFLSSELTQDVLNRASLLLAPSAGSRLKLWP